jgi:hypothetical protein
MLTRSRARASKTELFAVDNSEPKSKKRMSKKTLSTDDIESEILPGSHIAKFIEGIKNSATIKPTYANIDEFIKGMKNIASVPTINPTKPTADDLATASAAVIDDMASQTTNTMTKPTTDDLATASAAVMDDIASQSTISPTIKPTVSLDDLIRAVEEDDIASQSKINDFNTNPSITQRPITPPPLILASTPAEEEYRKRLVQDLDPYELQKRVDLKANQLGANHPEVIKLRKNEREWSSANARLTFGKNLTDDEKFKLMAMCNTTEAKIRSFIFSEFGLK